MLLVFTILAFVMTIVGGLFPYDLLSRAGMWRLFSLRAGLLLAVAFTEILPEAWKQNPTPAGWGALAAFVLLFVMENFAMRDACPEHLAECSKHTLGLAALLALSLHSFIDGFNLSVSFSAGVTAGSIVGVALALHKIADGFTLTSLLRQTSYPKARQNAMLGCVAAATPVGAAFSAAGGLGLTPWVSAACLGFAAGSFIYISAADILPQLHKSHDKSYLLFFGLGLFGFAALRLL